jgi:hypothetical protein
MNPLAVLNQLFQYSLLHLYAPIVENVGFSHPLTFAIITAHNTFSLTYLFLTAAVAYPLLHKKTWLIPAAITTSWIIISIGVVASLNIPTTTVIAATLPHGWLEFTAIAYWTNAIRKATQNNDAPKLIGTPTLRDYIKALTKPERLIALVKTDIRASFKATKLSLKTLHKNLKKPYLVMLILIAIAALIETFITPNMISLISNL